MNQQQSKQDDVDLTVEITKSINSMNPNAPHNLVYFSFKEHGYKAEANLSQTHFHVQVDGKKNYVDPTDAVEEQPVE